MDGKGSSAKGSRFERELCAKLSSWVSGGTQNDLFRRSVISGGNFTRSAKGAPGDIAGNHPLAYDFLQLFSVEAKHRRDLNFLAFLTAKDSFLHQVVDQTSVQATQHGVYWWVIAKQNNRRAFMLMPTAIAAIAASHAKRRLRWHVCFSDLIVMVDFEAFLANVPAAPFLEVVKEYRSGWFASNIGPTSDGRPGGRIPLAVPGHAVRAGPRRQADSDSRRHHGPTRPTPGRPRKSTR